MKTVTSLTEIAQKSTDVRFTEKVFLYEQCVDKIKTFISSTSFSISGDKTSDFSIGDLILLPLFNFNVELLIDDIEYIVVDDETIFTISGDYNISTLNVGDYVCKKINITNKIAMGGIKGFQSSIEGSELFEFDSGYLDIVVDNGDGYFQNKSKTGILNLNKVYWAKYFISFKGTSEEINWFSGLIDLSDLTPDLYNKTLTIRIYGHTYELTRYPAYNIINVDSKELPKIGGMFINNYIPSPHSSTGIKQVLFKPFTNSKMKNIVVQSVSADTSSGVKILEFRYPCFFRWDNGDWTSISKFSDTTDGVAELTGKITTSVAKVKFGDGEKLSEFPDSDSEIWVYISSDINVANNNRDIIEQGMPIIQFNNGDNALLRIHHQRVVSFNSSSSIYTDISDDVNASPFESSSIITIFENDDDYLLLTSSDRFYGVNFDFLTSVFSASLFEIYYSIGGDLFSAAMTSEINSLIDGTIGFTKIGSITWGDLENWSINNIVVDSSTSFKGYMIKIKRIDGSGECKTKEIKKIMRARGVDGDFLEFYFNKDKLTPQDLNDDVVVIMNKDESWSVGVWYENVSLQFLLEQSLIAANYNTNRIIDDAKIIGDIYTFNIWGKVPKNSNVNKPTALYVDFTNEIIYVATVGEIWKCTLSGNWEFITKFPYYMSFVNDSQIDDMWIYDGDLYYTRCNHFDVTLSLSPELYKYDFTTKLHTYLGSSFDLGKYTRRHGEDTLSGGNYHRNIGDNSYEGYTAGENICIPFRQRVDVNQTLLGNSGVMCWMVAPYPAPGIDFSLGDFPEWYFVYANPFYTGSSWVTLDYGGQYTNMDMGFYGVKNNGLVGTPTPKFEFAHSFGSQGCKILENTDFYGFKPAINLAGKIYNIITSASADETKPYAILNSGTAPQCCKKAIDSFLVEHWYFGFTCWFDSGNNTKSYSYLSDFLASNDAKFNWNKVFEFNNTGSVYTDKTSDYNNIITSTNVFTENGDSIYLGSQSKFKNIELILSSTIIGNVFSVKYWNGTDWTEVVNILSSNLEIGVLSYDVPRNWLKNTVNGVENYWIRIELTASVTLPLNVNRCINKENIIWDSELDTDHQRYMPLWISYNEQDNTICGSMFNRESSQLDSYPFQWCIFVFDLNSGNMYFSHTGENFTYDGTYLPKNFTYDSFNNKFLCMFENIRYQDRPCFLAEILFTDGDTITINKLGVPIETDWGSPIPLQCNPNNGNVYGFTSPNNFSLWEYSKEYFPRIEIAKFNPNDSIYDVLKYISQIMNFNMIIHSEKIIRITNKNKNNGTIKLEWNSNMVTSKPKFGYWKHNYDAVVVNFQNMFDENLKGEVKNGFDGWMKKVMKINNELIQNIHIAKIVSLIIYEYYNNLRISPSSIKTIILPQLECCDKFNIIMPSKIIDIDKNINFLVTSIKLNNNKDMEINGIEILS